MSSEMHGPWEYERTNTRGAYRRAALWWIDVPLGLGILALIAGVILLARGGVGTASAWADAALAAVLVPALLFGVLALVVFGTLVYLLARLLRWLPGRTAPAAAWLVRLSQGVRRGSDGLAEVVIRPLAAGAAVEAGLRGRRRP